MNRTEQELAFEKRLFKLISDNKGYVEVNFIDEMQRVNSNSDEKTNVLNRMGGVSIYLHYLDSVEVWDNAISDAETQLAKIKTIIQHDNNHPDFFTSIRNKMRNLRAIS